MHGCNIAINNQNGKPDAFGLATAGHTADGTNFASAWAETENNWATTTPPGHVVACWRLANMQANHYWTGKVPARGIWHYVVNRVGLNDVGKDNGYLDIWYDGELLGHFTGQHNTPPLQGLRMRTTPDLVIRAFYPGIYVHHNSQKNTVWIDDISIVAESPSLCTAPTDLKAERSADSIALTWTASEGATGYNVYRSDSRKQGVSTPFIRLTERPVAQPSCVDKSAAQGKPYYYLVTAVSAHGESTFSQEATAP